jgi:hypothetical protein
MSTEEPTVTTEPTVTAIDEKKAEDEGATTDKANWKDFFKKFTNGLITGVVIGVIIFGSAGLFLTKVANANILPTDLDVEPYKAFHKRDVEIEIIYMNPVKQLCCYGLGFWAKPEAYWIQEANFVNSNGLNFMDNFENTWLCDIARKSNPALRMPFVKNDRKSPFWTFEHAVLQEMTCKSFTIIQKIFYYMNYLPEWMIMIFCGLFFTIIISIIFILNFWYSIVSHISNISQLWQNLWDNGFNNPPIPYGLSFKVILPFLLFCGYLILIFYSVLFSPAWITLYTIVKSLTADYYIRMKNQPQPPQKMGIYDFIKNVLYYKKTFIIILVMFNLMSATNEYLGVSYMPGVVIAILILIFGMNILGIDEPKQLFPVLPDAEFPSLSLPVMKPFNDDWYNPCNQNAKKNPNTPVIKNEISKLTGEKINVLQVNGNNNFTGGSNAKKLPKVKLYNIQLV